MKSKLVLLASALVACLLIAGCGPESGDPGLLSLHVVGIQADQVFGAASPDPLTGAEAFRVSVSGPGMDTVHSEDVDISRNVIRIPDYPAGEDRQFTFEYLGSPDGAGQRTVLARGRTASLDVFADGDKVDSPMFVSPVNSMVRTYFRDAESGLPVESVPTLAGRVGATATELDDGRILICGGARVRGGASTWYMAADLENITDFCELYDPAGGRFEPVNARMTVGRAYHQALKLGSPSHPDGRVVLIGGYTQDEDSAVTPTALVDIYDPDTGTFTNAVNGKDGFGLPGGAGRALFTADVMNPDANLIIVVGGISDRKAAGGTWDVLWITDNGALGLLHGTTQSASGTGTIRYNHSMVRVSGFGSKLTGGAGEEAYLLIGGENESGIVDSIEPLVFDCPSKKACDVQSRNLLSTAIQGGGRTMAAAVYDAAHRLLYVAGGFLEPGGKHPTSRVEVYWVNDCGFKEGLDQHLSLPSAVGGLGVAALDDGKFLMTGGWDGTEYLKMAEILSPAETVSVDGHEYVGPVILSNLPPMDSGRAGHAMITDGTGRVLIFGGAVNDTGVPRPIMYNPVD